MVARPTSFQAMALKYHIDYTYVVLVIFAFRRTSDVEMLPPLSFWYILVVSYYPHHVHEFEQHFTKIY